MMEVRAVLVCVNQPAVRVPVRVGKDKLTADTYGSWLPSNPKNTNDCLDDPEWAEASHHAG
jgi:hypothetical protein